MAETQLANKRGNTWQGWPVVTITLNAAPRVLTGAAFLMQIRKSPTTPEVAAEWSLGEGIEPIDPEAGTFTVEPRILDLVAGTYVFDLQMTLASVRFLTPIEGTFEITPDVSRL